MDMRCERYCLKNENKIFASFGANIYVIHDNVLIIFKYVKNFYINKYEHILNKYLNTYLL